MNHGTISVIIIGEFGRHSLPVLPWDCLDVTWSEDDRQRRSLEQVSQYSGPISVVCQIQSNDEWISTIVTVLCLCPR